MNRLPYSTIGGLLTRGEAYAQLVDYLHEAQDQARQMSRHRTPEAYTKLSHSLTMCQEASALLAHLHNTEGTEMDRLLAKGWLGTSEMFKLTQSNVARLATMGLRPNHWDLVADLLAKTFWEVRQLFESHLQ
jgi:hypothetical protein